MRQPPRRKPVDLISPQRAEIAGAEENRDLVEFVRVIDETEQPDAGETDVIGRQRLRNQLARIEKSRRISEVLGGSVSYERNVDLLLVIEAAVEELETEWQPFRGPDAGVAVEADVPVLLVAQVLDRIRKVLPGRHELALRERPGNLHHSRAAEGPARR